MAEAHNPETRVAMGTCPCSSRALGVAPSELYPTLAAAVLSETSRSNVLFGNEFFLQTIQDFQVGLDLNYTVFDFGARSGRISAAKAELLAANFAFNDTNRNIIYQVEQAYYRLLRSVGQEDAARASLAKSRRATMAVDTNTKPQRLLSRRLSIGFALAAAVLGAVALYRTNHYPRTDDAAVFANFIGIAPQVDGPVIRLNVRDNQFVKKGELL